MFGHSSYVPLKCEKLTSTCDICKFRFRCFTDRTHVEDIDCEHVWECEKSSLDYTRNVFPRRVEKLIFGSVQNVLTTERSYKAVMEKYLEA